MEAGLLDLGAGLLVLGEDACCWDRGPEIIPGCLLPAVLIGGACAV
jgi:hypothetical protein